jgi:hypothetical protein
MMHSASNIPPMQAVTDTRCRVIDTDQDYVGEER